MQQYYKELDHGRTETRQEYDLLPMTSGVCLMEFVIVIFVLWGLVSLVFNLIWPSS